MLAEVCITQKIITAGLNRPRLVEELGEVVGFPRDGGKSWKKVGLLQVPPCSYDYVNDL